MEHSHWSMADGPVNADKPALRHDLLAARRARSDAAIDTARLAIRTTILAAQQRQGWRSVAGYVPLRSEPGSVELLDALVAAGCRVLVPTLRADRDLDWSCWVDDTGAAQSALLGPAAIGDVDAVLVPALAVARDGSRLGRGGGSYDRALSRVRRSVPVIALLYAEELADSLPVDPWDIPVSAAVTPLGWYDLLPLA